MTIDLILGTAGHIDHGKSALVRALTGVDPDRLPEEKRRGITIELGFAELLAGDFRLGFVDVPGHERFVRQMLAGAASMDLALLIVAADEAVKPQTREHLDILRLLSLPAGVVAITKCDLVGDDWLQLVREEIRELTAGTFLRDAPVVATSAHTGQGLDELRDALAVAAQQAHRVREPQQRLPFRMAIDRVFTVAGHGTVVTGSVMSGAAGVGDHLALEPAGREVRVKGLQNHDRPVETVCRGQRAAINLAGVHHQEVERGEELAAIGYLAATRRIVVALQSLAGAAPLKDRQRVRLHAGAAETMATVRVLKRDALEPGEAGLVQLFLKRPIVAVWGQPVVLRSESPVTTLGGGRVLSLTSRRIAGDDVAALAMLRQLQADAPALRVEAAVFFAGFDHWKEMDILRAAGVADAASHVHQLLASGKLVDAGGEDRR
ncbi:MAG: selenocysteine-specific translation elongation factor, partial [Planctomycetales bacterium]|nr:selenocysteine-specific translation elongation factor [Planctomycetales bacterium]